MINPSTIAQASAEMLVSSYATSYKLPTIITRGNNVYGPRQYPEKLIPKFISLAMSGGKFPVYGNGEKMRSYMYVEDVASAFCTILHRGVTGEIYNIGTPSERTVMSVAKDICNHFKLDPTQQIVHVQDRPFHDDRYFMNIQKILDLGWSEQTSWQEGLKKTVAWYKAHPDNWPDISLALNIHPEMEKIRKEELILGQNRFLVFGQTGWLGGILGNILSTQGEQFCFSKVRLQDRAGVLAEVDRYRPTHILNAAGLTGRPNVDWCETHRVETLRTNVIGVLTLADICEMKGIHMTNFATGCIFEYDARNPEGSGKGFTEEDKPNFHGSFYSHTKAIMEDLLSSYSKVLTLRIRMPISEDLEFPRNFLYKISHYAKVTSVPNSMTVLPELMPMSIEMAKRNLTGVFNFTNPGVISHNECLELYKKYYRPDFTWENFSLEEQAKVIVASRSNNELDAKKLKTEFPELLPIKESLIKYVFEPKEITRSRGLTK